MTTSTREEIKIGPMAIRFLVEGEESGGSVAVFEFDVPAGAKVPAAHSHDGYEETIYGLEGVLTWTIEGRADRRRPRRGALHPPRRRPSFDNTHDVDAKALAIVTPGILGPDYFREVAAILDAAAGRAARSRRAGRGHAPSRAHPGTVNCSASSSSRRPRARVGLTPGGPDSGACPRPRP